jgi:PAS domain S-box-containing protein
MEFVVSLHLAVSTGVLDKLAAEDVLQAFPFAAYVTDLEGRIAAFNDAAVALWGRIPRLGEHWCGSHKLYWPDGRPMRHDECPMAQTLKTGTPVRGLSAILERLDGSRIHFAPSPALLRDPQGRVVGGINVLMDITENRKAEHADAHLAALVESSDDAIISKNLDGIIQSWNRGAERIFGYTTEEAVGHHISLLIPADRLDEEPGIIERIRRGERTDHYETVRRRKDGSLIDISLTVSPIKDAGGRIVGASKIARDISDKKRSEEARELLLHEIKHRVKNTLGTVQAIAAQTFREGPKEERNAFTGRLRALSSAHDLLTQQHWDQVLVTGIVARALAPFQENRNERFRISGSEAILNANQALLLAMALHELATNAVKYGALSNAAGTVNLAWRLERRAEGPSLWLEWRESGGPAVGAPARRGFGSTLIERALRQERGHSAIEFRPEGVVCTLEMQL